MRPWGEERCEFVRRRDKMDERREQETAAHLGFGKKTLGCIEY